MMGDGVRALSMTMTFRNLEVPIGLGGHAKDGSVRNLGTDKSARSVHIEKNINVFQTFT